MWSIWNNLFYFNTHASLAMSSMFIFRFILCNIIVLNPKKNVSKITFPSYVTNFILIHICIHDWNLHFASFVNNIKVSTLCRFILDVVLSNLFLSSLSLQVSIFFLQFLLSVILSKPQVFMMKNSKSHLLGGPLANTVAVLECTTPHRHCDPNGPAPVVFAGQLMLEEVFKTGLLPTYLCVVDTNGVEVEAYSLIY